MTSKRLIQTALISVSDKTHLVDFAHALNQAGVKILSTGGTAEVLSQAGIPIILVSEITGFPEIMEGRVKTLHPKIHGGILGKRDTHETVAKNHHIAWIDLVVVNLYPFQSTLNSGAECAEIIENIDIGGPAMLRAAAKNYEWVTVVQDPNDYESVKEQIKTGGVSLETRRNLAAKAFSHTAQYDAAIAHYFNKQTPLTQQASTTLSLNRLESLRYGENPHQAASLFSMPFGYGLSQAKIIQGKALSYNNLMDAEAALQCVKEFNDPTAVIVKHANPCGVSSAAHIDQAYTQAFNADSQSAFGGIIALNRICTAEIATHVSSIFIEVILAPGFTPEALALLSKKQNLRVLALNQWDKIQTPYAFRAISGGLLIQDTDQHDVKASDLECVTKRKPSLEETDELLFAWKVAKYLKSNAIAITKNRVSLGLSGGQVSRISALNFALERASGQLQGSGCVLASDAFFPFRDNIDALKGRGISAIIQPGGSIRDAEVIEACDEFNLSMVFTHIRCFNH
jgi:phosphoribosylaminoimidazolecarboxamide formyltransferase/IMP cyclohydrolase